MRKWLPPLFIVAGVVLSLAVFARLPATMPIHWDARGQPNGFARRGVAAFILPAVSLGIWLLLRVIPRIDPRAPNIAKFRQAFDLFVAVILAMMLAIHVAVIGYALGWPVPVARVVPLMIGALFVLLGLLMPQFRSNFFIGIRTPWTLSSEQVWTKTHRVGGYLFVMAGLLFVLAALVPTPLVLYVAITSAMAVAVITVAYSYIVWRAETRG